MSFGFRSQRQKKEQHAMIIEAARLAGSNLLSARITIGAVQIAWPDDPAADRAVVRSWRDLCRHGDAVARLLLPGLPDWAGWAGTIAAIIAGVGLALVLALFIAPVTAVMAGLFLDEIAEVIETRDYPGETPGRPMPLGQSIKQSLGFLLVVGLGNIVALLLLLVPGINLAAFFLVNGYLLGREYFEFAAMRFMSPRTPSG
jgi:CysZ protein